MTDLTLAVDGLPQPPIHAAGLREQDQVDQA